MAMTYRSFLCSFSSVHTLRAKVIHFIDQHQQELLNFTISNIHVFLDPFISCKEAKNKIAHKYVGYKELALGVFFLIKIDSILFLLFY